MHLYMKANFVISVILLLVLHLVLAAAKESDAETQLRPKNADKKIADYLDNHKLPKVTPAPPLLPAAASAVSAPNAHSVLILSTTNGVEATRAAAVGLTPVVVTPAQWSAMSAADFASFRAIVLGDPFCHSDPSLWAAAVGNVNVWSSVLKGNIIVAGNDPSFHVVFGSNSAGATEFTDVSIQYAASDPILTGAYISLSCFGTQFPTVPVLSGLGTFTTQGTFSGTNLQHIVTPQPGTPLASLSDSDLRNWGSSTHSFFTSFPNNFVVFATNTDNFGTVPYILLKPANCCQGLFPGSACCQGNQQIYVCSGNGAEILVNQCRSPVSKCQNIPLGSSGGLVVQSAVCNV